jgi:hypothetical protein
MRPLTAVAVLAALGFSPVLWAETQNEKGPMRQKNIYPELRERALSTPYEKLGLELSRGQTEVYGLVVDMNMGDGIATVVCFKTGDASLYLSSGGGFIGGIGQPPVRRASLALVATGQKYLPKAGAAPNRDLPDQGAVRFYWLTNHGVFSAGEKTASLEDGHSEWTGLYAATQDVITQFRLLEEKQEAEGTHAND